MPAPQARPGDVPGDRYPLEARAVDVGLGECWEARDQQLNTPVLVKLLGEGAPGPVSDPRSLHALRARAALAATPEAPAIIDAGEHGERVFVVYRHPDVGMSLASWIAAHRKLRTLLPFTTVAAVFTPIAAALEALAAHTATGPAHGALSPRSVRIHREAPGLFRVRVLDAGLAPFLMGPAGEHPADARWRSPEQSPWSPSTETTASDVFCLGVVLADLFGGPPAGTTWGTLSRNDGARLRSTLARVRVGLPATVLDTLAAALSADPASRPTVAALRECVARAWGPEAWGGRSMIHEPEVVAPVEEPAEHPAWHTLFATAAPAWPAASSSIAPPSAAFSAPPAPTPLPPPVAAFSLPVAPPAPVAAFSLPVAPPALAPAPAAFSLPVAAPALGPLPAPPAMAPLPVAPPSLAPTPIAQPAPQGPLPPLPEAPATLPIGAHVARPSGVGVDEMRTLLPNAGHAAFDDAPERTSPDLANPANAASQQAGHRDDDAPEVGSSTRVLAPDPPKPARPSRLRARTVAHEEMMLTASPLAPVIEPEGTRVLGHEEFHREPSVAVEPEETRMIQTSSLAMEPSRPPAPSPAPHDAPATLPLVEQTLALDASLSESDMQALLRRTSDPRPAPSHPPPAYPTQPAQAPRYEPPPPSAYASQAPWMAPQPAQPMVSAQPPWPQPAPPPATPWRAEPLPDTAPKPPTRVWLWLAVGVVAVLLGLGLAALATQ